MTKIGNLCMRVCAPRLYLEPCAYLSLRSASNAGDKYFHWKLKKIRTVSKFLSRFSVYDWEPLRRAAKEPRCSVESHCQEKPSKSLDRTANTNIPKIVKETLHVVYTIPYRLARSDKK